MVDVNKLLQDEVDRLEQEVLEMKPVYDWAMKNGLKNFNWDDNEDVWSGAVPIVTGEHVGRFYHLFHWNDIDDDSITGNTHKVEKAESLLGRIIVSLNEEDGLATPEWIRNQLGKIFAGWGFKEQYLSLSQSIINKEKK